MLRLSGAIASPLWWWWWWWWLIVTDSSISDSLGFDLPRRAWSLLNRFRPGQGSLSCNLWSCQLELYTGPGVGRLFCRARGILMAIWAPYPSSAHPTPRPWPLLRDTLLDEWAVEFSSDTRVGLPKWAHLFAVSNVIAQRSHNTVINGSFARCRCFPVQWHTATLRLSLSRKLISAI